MKTTVFQDGEKFYEAGSLKVSLLTYPTARGLVTIEETNPDEDQGEVILYAEDIDSLINALLDIKREAINARALKSVQAESNEN